MAQCETCKDILIASPFQDPQHISLNQLTRSSDHGICQGCCLIYDAIVAIVPEYVRSRAPIVRVIKHGDEIELSMVANELENTDRKFRLSGVLGSTKPWVWAGIGTSASQHRRRRMNTSSAESILWAQTQLRDCASEHQNCPANKSPLPSRVIDVGLDMVQNPQSIISLYESRGEVELYVCLSHRWDTTSDSATAQTTKDTLLRNQVEIPWSGLNETFQDAIRFTRKLGIRYIWIDSLCIVQDDADDWQRESVNMCSIFAGSTLTIFASDSGTPGLFKTYYQDPGGHKLQPRNFGQRGKGWEAFIYDPSPKFISHHILNPKHAMHSVLLRRGWVYQERLLSPRILHFGPDELVWECREKVSCQCSRILTVSKVDHDYTRLLLTPSSALETVAAVYRWPRIVAEYSQTNLTHPSDRLAAIGGLAKQLQSLQGCQYLAGLWESSLVLDLQWEPLPSQHGHPISQRPQQWWAPSWSWAGAVRAVYYPPKERDMYIKILCEVLDCQVIPKRFADEFGQLESAWLTARGKLKLLRVYDEWEPLSGIIFDRDKPWNWFKNNDRDDLQVRRDVDWDAGPDKVSIMGDDQNRPFLFRLAKRRPFYIETMYSLVLRRMRGEANVFKRIGIATSRADSKRWSFQDVEDSVITIV